MLSFQALLTDADGSPLPGPTVDLEFNIYDGVGALVEGPVLLNDVPVTGGVADALVPVTASSFDGSERQLGVTVNPPAEELSPRIPLVTVPYAFRVDRVESEELTDDLELGDAATAGSLTVYRTSSGGSAITLSGVDSRISTYANNGQQRTHILGLAWGEIQLFDNTGNEQTANLSATLNSGGELSLNDATGGASVLAEGDSTGGSITLYDASNASTLQLSGAAGTVDAEDSINIVASIGGTTYASLIRAGNGGHLDTYDASGRQTVYLGSSDFELGGFGLFAQGDSDLGVNIFGQTPSTGGGSIFVGSTDGTETVTLSGDGGGGAALLTLKTDSVETIRLDAGIDGGNGGRLNTFDASGRQTVYLGSTDFSLGGFGLFSQGDSDLGVNIFGQTPSTGGGSMRVGNTDGTETVTINGDGGEGAALLTLRADSVETIRLDAGNDIGGGSGITLSNDAGVRTIGLDGDVSDDGAITLYNASAAPAIQLSCDSTSSAGRIGMWARIGNDPPRETVEIAASDDGNDDARIILRDGATETVRLDAGGSGSVALNLADGERGALLTGGVSGSGGRLWLFQDDGTNTLALRAAQAGSNDGSVIHMYQADGEETIRLDGDGGGGGAGVTLSNSQGASTIVFDADSSDDGVIKLYDADGNAAIELHSDSAYSAAQLTLYALDSGGTLQETVEIIASEGDDGSGQSTNGGQIKLRNAAGTTTITLDAEYGAGGDGRITTPVLQITGGADLSENFDVSGTHKPGYVVCIDAQNPSKLVVSAKAYDRTVAGVISGAKGILPGMLMGQRGSEADGELPVALTGRVYVYADAALGAIIPGDLLTTSDTLGHAMKVIDYTKAQGAILGKAMTSLDSGTGFVLVLVSLQ